MADVDTNLFSEEDLQSRHINTISLLELSSGRASRATLKNTKESVLLSSFHQIWPFLKRIYMFSNNCALDERSIFFQ
jgi:hypothetical protein